MPIEIRELLVRAFVGNKDPDKEDRDKKKDQPPLDQEVDAADAVAAMQEMIKRQKER